MLETIFAFSGTRIAVLGDLMLDRYVLGETTRISPEAPIPVFRIAHERSMPGGAANVACNVAALGGEVRLVGLVGNDAAAATLKGALSGVAGLEATLVCDPLRPTTLKTRYVAQGQQLLRVDSESTVPASGPPAHALMEAVEGALAAAQTLVLSDYAKGVLGPLVLPRVMEFARARGCLVIVDPKQVDMRCYAGADIITPNVTEAAKMTGLGCEDDAGVVEAARRIGAAVGCRHVVITRGAKGMSVVGMANGDEPFHVPAVLREIHDVSGAGDTALAALALALTSGAPIEIATRLANIAAGIAVSKPGTATVPLEDLVTGVQRTSSRREHEKIVSRAEAARTATRWREEGRKIVFTNGCFDLLHPGHVRLIHSARAEGDRLIVALNSDDSVRRLKGAGRPIQSEVARATVIAAMEGVDAVLVFEEDTPLHVIEELKPDVIVKGADYTEDEVVGGSFVRSNGGRVVLAPLEAGHSTTSAIARAGRGLDAKAKAD
jgi:D-beta-D-heptose 7-phosphate kinase / D-beta-D-heptose 1-phosphate adenosyltransferase